MVKADGFTCAEAAKMLDIPVGTVKYQVHEALLRLRAQLGDEGARPGKKASVDIPAPTALTKEVVTMTENDPETFSSFEEAESLLGVPVLGFIPMISEEPLRLLGDMSHFSPLMESYRSLRTHLRFCKEVPLKTLVITSSVPAEGKSTAAANLAMALAKDKKRVILIDADLRRPRQHKLLQVEARPGLTDLLLGTHSLDQVLRPSGVEGVSLITSGTPSTIPTELIGSPEMEQLLEKLKAQSDIVVIDTAPVLAVADTCALAHATDGVLLVIWAGETKRAHVQRTADLLKRCRAQVVGTVLNCMPMPGYYGKYYVLSEEEELVTSGSSKESQINE
ncbi:MAG: polysaccharide biosynthesis tyrosine autokinase [Armatimonas sp.]